MAVLLVLERLRQEDCCKLKVSLVYIVIFNPAKTTEYVCIWVPEGNYVCMWVHLRNQKRASYPLGLELQAAVNCFVGARNHTWVLSTSSQGS